MMFESQAFSLRFFVVIDNPGFAVADCR